MTASGRREGDLRFGSIITDNLHTDFAALKELLDEQADRYNRPDFVENDPICVSHTYTKLQDIEISAFWTAVLSWGQRKTIISKAKELFRRMDDSPYDFIRNHGKADLKSFLTFRHRTFNGIDAAWFIRFFKEYYTEHTTLEDAFAVWYDRGETNTEQALNRFHRLFFASDKAPERTRKHVSAPERGSACKRLNMFLRWMVRNDGRGVDFGLWKRIRPADLFCPCDVHVASTSRRLGLIRRRPTDWKAVEELTGNLRTMDPQDPVRYDFALFGLGLEERENFFKSKGNLKVNRIFHG